MLPEPHHSTSQLLKRCDYPSATDVHRHGIQNPLPEELRTWDSGTVALYRGRYKSWILDNLNPRQIVQVAQVVGESFAAREPMCRHLCPPSVAPAALRHARHTDTFGSASFGLWTTPNIMQWFVRGLVLTDPTSSMTPVPVNRDVLTNSLAIIDAAGRVTGAALNETMPPIDAEPQWRGDDVFIESITSFISPVLGFLVAQDKAGITALCAKYPSFQSAYERGRVGHHFMIARSDALAIEDTFELVAASAERFHEQGFKFMVVEATNQWTGAACEALGATAVHFAPFRSKQVVPVSPTPLPNTVSSSDGFISNKDSGSMFYVLRLG
jgi:hypothetical protein